MFCWRVRILRNAFVRNTHVLIWKDKPLFAICQSILRSENSVLFLCRNSTLKYNHILLKGKNSKKCSSEKHTHVLLGNEKPFFVIFKELLEVRTVFLFSIEALLLKIITFFWNGKNFMKRFWEKQTFLSLKLEAVVWDMSKNS